MIKLRALLLCIVGCLVLCGIFTTSCQNDTPPTTIKNEDNPNVISSIEQNMGQILAIPTTPTSSKHAIRRIKVGDGGRHFDTIPLYILHLDTMCPRPKITTVRDLYTLIHDYGATVSTDPNQPHTDIVQISENDAKDALLPLITESKKYFYNVGFSENEIQTLLIEHNLTEASLISIVLSATEYEGNMGAYGSLLPGVNDNYLTEEDQYYVQSINWGKVKTCALDAIGYNLLGEIINYGVTKYITKEILLTVVEQSALKVASGYVAAAMILIDFSVCYFG